MGSNTLDGSKSDRCWLSGDRGVVEDRLSIFLARWRVGYLADHIASQIASLWRRLGLIARLLAGA
jgi:hypothetical protein